MRTAWENPQYIINLTRNLVGEQALFEMGLSEFDWFSWLEPTLVPRIRRMNDETLGRICAYGTQQGLHHGPTCQVAFLNLTGFRDVKPGGFSKDKSGRELLEEMAVATIICVATDIVLQKRHQVLMAADIELEQMVSQTERDMAHARQRGELSTTNPNKKS